MESEHMAISAIRGWRIYPGTHQIPTMSSTSIKPSAPMTVLSSGSTRTGARPALVVGTSIFHGLIVAALSAGVQRAADHGAPPTVAMIMAPVVPLAVPDQKPSPPVPAMAIDARNSDPPVQPGPITEAPQPAPMTEPPPPMPSTSVGATDRPPGAADAPESPLASFTATETPPAPMPLAAPSAGPAISDEVVPQASKTGSAPPAKPDTAAHSHDRPRRVVQRSPSSQEGVRLVTASARPAASSAPDPAQSSVPTVAQAGHTGGPQLTDRIRNAVQAAVRCPPAARMMGQSGKAGVAFDYRAGAIVGRAQLARSSGTSVLDAAALTAVRTAHYPQGQPGDPDQLLHLLIWVEEACGG
jgi:TonB family protein